MSSGLENNPYMSKPDSRAVVGFLLGISLLANVALIYQAEARKPKHLAINEKLVGTLRSKNPHGIRLILLYGGDFVLTNYGRPDGPVGRWEAKGGRFKIWWAVDEEGGTVVEESPYLLNADRATLQLTRDIFNHQSKEFIKAPGQP